MASLVAQRLKRLPAMRETWVRSLGREDPLEKEMATHSSIPAWRIRWTEEPGELQSTGSQRVGHDWATSLSLNKPYWPKNHINNSKVNRVILRFLKNFVLLMHFFPSLIRFNRAICINTKIYKVNINIVIILSDMDNLEDLFTYTYFSRVRNEDNPITGVFSREISAEIK